MTKLVEEFVREFVNVLRVPQIRVLLALSDNDGGLPIALSRSKINEKCGLALTSGTVTRAMHGLPGNTSSGPAFPGLVNLGLVSVTDIDVDGVLERCYQITPLGLNVLECCDKDLPKVRSKEASTNKRYKKISTELDVGRSEVYGQDHEAIYSI